jgi:hypothetical protein
MLAIVTKQSKGPKGGCARPASCVVRIALSSPHEWVTSGTQLSWGTAQGKTRQRREMNWLSTDNGLKGHKETPKPLSGPLIPHHSRCSEPKLTVTTTTTTTTTISRPPCRFVACSGIWDNKSSVQNWRPMHWCK